MKPETILSYKPTQGCYDELFEADGTPRPLLSKIIDELTKSGVKECEHREKRINNTFYYHELLNGADEPRVVTDSLPIVLSPEDCSLIYTGLEQRAKLFDMLAKDIYGEQKLTAKGVIPPAVTFANPCFLPMLKSGKNEFDCYVNLMSSDIVRNSEGRFTVISDGFQVTEGIGNALENRLLMSGAYPEILHSLRIERLNEFFDDFRQTLIPCTEGNNENAVLLASEPGSRRRSEDSLLARYLKLLLVENDDLTVRGFNVYLKTLTGLKKINTIFRRVEDGMCDPLELRIDAGEGAVGLISAVRTGNVKVINALGTGILETPIIRAFLPSIAENLLGEKLLIDTAEAYWLGDNEKLKKVFASPDEYMFFNAFNTADYKIFKNMTPTGRMSLLEKVSKNPENYTAEKFIITSTVPYLKDGVYRAGEAHMRFFVSNTENDCKVMPGGFGRVIDRSNGCSAEKDIWMLSNSKAKSSAAYHTSVIESIPLSRAGGDLPSRAADNLFRLGLALENAEFITRISRIAVKRLEDKEISDIKKLLPLFFKSIDPDIKFNENGQFESVLKNIVLKKTQKSGLQPLFKEIRFFAVQLRDRLSEDTWRFIKDFGETRLPEGTDVSALLPYLQKIIADSAAFEGMASEGMTRGHGWRFLDMGRRITHAIRMLLLIKNMLYRVGDDEQQILTALLEIGDGSLTYFRRYGVRLHSAPVTDLLLCDESNPHSVAYQAMRLKKETAKLSVSKSEALFSDTDKRIMKLTSELRLVDVYVLSEPDNFCRQKLADFCDERIEDFRAVSDMLSREYLNHFPHKDLKSATATEV